MFLIHVQIDLCLHYPVDVWPYGSFVLACEYNEVIVKLRRQMGFFCIWKNSFVFISVGITVCILRYV